MGNYGGVAESIKGVAKVKFSYCTRSQPLVLTSVSAQKSVKIESRTLNLGRPVTHHSPID
jgi:hypothetical protein